MKINRKLILIQAALVVAGVLGYTYILNETPKPRIFAISFLFFFWLATDVARAYIQKTGASTFMQWVGYASFLITSTIGLSIIYMSS
ncbi:hypothetical protein [Jeotgalibacillus sp. R-1-5s-1]|uniref:hypothetical protein n=1 Tax=Jeotgalibacillus sp. R-1-5s-1 TaxID=2555897 RepID=UPI00106A019E|nr:hypothetical protein [Jeotgalibacillus sp. R-1-5s-1]TFE00783.1 hypothetical protein E2491_04530 [Jeotgalibacillus sp. R-1-5s-1]